MATVTGLPHIFRGLGPVESPRVSQRDDLAPSG